MKILNNWENFVSDAHKISIPYNVLASHDLGINVFYSIFQFHFAMNQGNFKADQIFIMLSNSEATY